MSVRSTKYGNASAQVQVEIPREGNQRQIGGCGLHVSTRETLHEIQGGGWSCSLPRIVLGLAGLERHGQADQAKNNPPPRL